MISSLPPRLSLRPARATRASKLFKSVLAAIQEKKGEQIASLDLRKIDEAVADFFILCEAGSFIQIKAIGDAVVDAVHKATGEKPYHTESSEHWTLIDYVNIVVHIFNREQRKFYDLESLWADAGRMDHDQ
ncbi:MAG: ribosome silencing factor [Bacteroidetes bacterium]|nr:ribosome silencing factor [Bacteroidota bacterium]MBS1630879.1 ribosome silencing factor [Bacteroidota bacterium]